MKIGFAAASFALFAGHASIAQAQDDCTPIRFAAGRASAVVQGSAPAADTVCYRFTAAAGQTAMLKVVSGRNVIFAIDDLVDAQDNYRFSTQARTYTIRVGQMFRSVTPQRFSLSLAISGERGANAPATPPAGATGWKVMPSPNAPIPRVGLQARAEAPGTTIYGGCNAGIGAGLSLTLDGYRGRALRKVDDLSQTVTFVVTDTNGSRISHKGAMHYSGNELVTSQLLPVSFVDTMGRGGRLTLVTYSGEQIAALPLAGFERFRAAMRQICGM